MMTPCQLNPDAWYPAEEQRGARSAEVSREVHHTKWLCRTQCPELRRCAQAALSSKAQYGIWAGVELPGVKARAALAKARAQLQTIANATDDAVA